MNPGTIVVIAYGILAIVGGIITFKLRASLAHSCRIEFDPGLTCALSVLTSDVFAGHCCPRKSAALVYMGKSSEEAAIKCHTTRNHHIVMVSK